MTEPAYNPRAMTWAALLAHWSSFARQAVALPEDAQGLRMRESVVDLITLQAVTCALGEVHELSSEQRAVGLDRAGVLIDKHEKALRKRWGEEAMPEQMQELIADAHRELDAARAGSGKGNGGEDA